MNVIEIIDDVTATMSRGTIVSREISLSSFFTMFSSTSRGSTDKSNYLWGLTAGDRASVLQEHPFVG